MEWRDQVAVVTGGARGLGRATAWLLAQRGAAVCVNYAAHGDAAEALIAAIATAGGRAIAVAADVAEFGRGRGDGQPRRSRAGSSDHPGEQRWRGLAGYAGHLRPGAGRAHAPSQRRGHDQCHARSDGGMRERRYGRIVNVSSIAAIGTALSGNAFYAATKAEVVILTRRFALELGQHGITVNAVAPGFVRTDMTQRGRGAADWPGTEERFAARAMMGRIGEPEDIANAVVFLASPESGWITAQVLTVDGGRMDYIGHG